MSLTRTLQPLTMTTLPLRFANGLKDDAVPIPGGKPMPYLSISIIASIVATLFANYSSGEVIAVISAVVAGTSAILAGGAAAVVKIIYAIKGIPGQVTGQVSAVLDKSAVPTTPEQMAAFKSELVAMVAKAVGADAKVVAKDLKDSDDATPKV